MRKLILGGFITIAAIVAGFLFLMRGCLSRFDERFVTGQVLYCAAAEKEVIFSIIQSEKATSYSNKRGLIHKTVSTTYLVQSNDALTGALLTVQKVKKHSDVKSFPVETLGVQGQLVWVYMGELMAFDAFTLEKKADTQILETHNPFTKNQWPKERRYYQYDAEKQQMRVTLSNGSVWKLDAACLQLQALPDTNDEIGKSLSGVIHEQVLFSIRQQDSLYQQYRNQQINRTEYALKLKQLQKERDSLYTRARKADKNERSDNQLHNRQRMMREALYPSYSQLHISMDTIAGKLFTLLSTDEWQQAHTRIQWQSANGDARRRMLYTAPYTINRFEEAEFLKPAGQPLSHEFFLDGGFLLDRATAGVIRLQQPASWLIISKSVVGREGTLVLQRVDTLGNNLWRFDTGLTEWGQWQLVNNRLLITGAQQANLGYRKTHLLYLIDLNNGSVKGYDYFTDKMITPAKP